MRQLDPDRGRILLDGVDLRDLRRADLARQFAVVPQRPVLFSTTIAENIAYGVPGAAREEIVAAAKRARADEFIEQLERGYDTRITNDGAQLSAGERQRLSVARAFLMDAPILVLDEPTSAMDVNTEAKLVEGIEELARGRTTLLVTHRLSLLGRADIVLYVEGGRVTELEGAEREELRGAHPAPLPGHGLAPGDVPASLTGRSARTDRRALPVPPADRATRSPR